MNFTLLDRITSITENKNIKTVKCLSRGEEYLADHFPGNPVMPGVLQLEAMIQSAAWLLRVTQNFSHSMVVLCEARNVTYGKFVAPGDQLLIDVDLLEVEDSTARFRGKGRVDGSVVVKAQLDLKFFNLGDIDGALTDRDKTIIEAAKTKFSELGGVKAIEVVAEP
ncbi:MAG: beta-hydroxyacyl-ACP dehydratase [Planctomycetes bacterium]|nr:beta-hydroxyacyl-ACP dehydratase [Planctomycetota bacterium]